MSEEKEKALIDAANYHVDMQYPMGVEREYPFNDFIAGAEWMKKQIHSGVLESNEKALSAEEKAFDLAVKEYCKESESDGFLFAPDKNGCSLDKSNGYNAGFLNGFEKGYLMQEQRISELEKENAEYRAALQEITRTNWVNGKYFGKSSAQLHITAVKIAEQALKPKEG